MDSDHNTTPLEAGRAPLRVHFNRLWQAIRDDLRAGHTVAGLYRKLRNTGEWPGSYGSLRAYVARALKDGDAPRYRAHSRTQSTNTLN